MSSLRTKVPPRRHPSLAGCPLAEQTFECWCPITFTDFRDKFRVNVDAGEEASSSMVS